MSEVDRIHFLIRGTKGKVKAIFMDIICIKSPFGQGCGAHFLASYRCRLGADWVQISHNNMVIVDLID